MAQLFTNHKTFGINDQKKEIDNRMKLIHMPSNVFRKLRTLDEMANFKSSEFQNLFFYFGIYLFEGIWKDEHYNIMFFLSSVVFKLFIRLATENQIEAAKKEMDQVIEVFRASSFANLLSKYNTHCLIHLYDDRKMLGPLCLNSAYGYEDKLQSLKQSLMSHFTRVESLARKFKVEKRLIECETCLQRRSFSFLSNNFYKIRLFKPSCQ